MSSRLAAAHHEVVAVEPLGKGASTIAARTGATVLCSTLEQLCLPPKCLAVVGLFDVIEHISDPMAMLTEVHRVLEPGALVVLTVPAMPVLWSDADEAAGHARRYRRRDLDELMASCAFERVRSEYLFASLVVPALLLRVLPYRLGRRQRSDETFAMTSRHLRPPSIVDSTIRTLLDLEHSAARHLRLPFGTSVLGVYRRLTDQLAERKRLKR
jgi:SAM-dependent methyltransferase